MAIEARKLVDSEHGLLDRAIFHDQEIYQQELEKIFTRAWLFIGHESLVPNPNDFFNTYMGEDPVIVTRDGKGQLHAMLNMCRHRGNRVVRADDGNAKNFMCTYHGWTYSSDGGKLVSVPGLQEAYYGELDVDHLGLIEVAQLDTYAGLIFATWDPETPSLEDYLGDARWALDVLFNKRDGGVELLGPDKWILPTNWKMPADNFGSDGYHGAISHRSLAIVRAHALGKQPPQMWDRFRNRSIGQFTSGDHAAGGTLREEEPEWVDRYNAYSERDPILAEYQKEMQPEMDRRLGRLRARRVIGSANTIFPHFSMLTFKSFVRIWHPRGPGKTEVWGYVFRDKEAPEKVKDVLRKQSMLDFGVAGIQEQDDADNWIQCVAAGKSVTGRKYPQNLSMGLGHEVTDPLMPGTAVLGVNEHLQRTGYRRWQQFMEADSWADIPISAHTAKYEGTATFKG